MKRTTKMGHVHIPDTTVQAQTIADLCGQFGKKVETVRRTWSRKGWGQFDRTTVPTPEQVAILFPVSASPVASKKEKTAKVKAAGAKQVKAAKALAAGLVQKFTVRQFVLLIAFILPTLASVSNTINVAHSMSGSALTGLAIMGVVSATPLLFLFAGRTTKWAIPVVLFALAFEAFCNAASIFRSVMGDMAYSLTTVSGKPTAFLDMVATFTGSDHQDVAKGLSAITALLIGSVQVVSLYELKKK